MKRIFAFPIHPLFWAVFPPLALLGNNISQVHPGDAVRSLLVSLAVVILVWAFLRLVMGDWHKSAIMASVFMVLFFIYGHVYHQVEYYSILGVNLGRHRVLISLVILILALVFTWTLKRGNSPGITSSFNLVGMLVLVYPLFQVASYEIRTSPFIAGDPDVGLLAMVEGLQVPPDETPPDIYYIILDTYTRADVLSGYFHYDNSSFLDDLAAHGFYTAGCSRSNYSYTALSLASTLNYSYADALGTHLTPTNTNTTDIYPYLFNNAVVYTLRRLGYEFVAFDSGYSPTEFRDADTYYSQDRDLLGIILQDGINPYESIFLDTSMAMFVYELSPRFSLQMQKFLRLDTAYVVHRNRILYTLNRLERIASTPGPKFVFAHILAPHNPFVFGPNGEYIERKTPFTLNNDQDVISKLDYAKGYTDQVVYLNQRIQVIIDRLLTESAVPPVIILQGDHGVSFLLEWSTTILNSYHLPGNGESLLYQDISPVNTFRVIFNQYFGGNLPLLPDRSCFTDASRAPFVCTPVPDPNSDCARSVNP